jgi:hypothetical protein
MSAIAGIVRKKASRSKEYLLIIMSLTGVAGKNCRQPRPKENELLGA